MDTELLAPPKLARLIEIIERGGIVAYPTEGLFGLGCSAQDASAVERLRALKSRPPNKGFILIADRLERFSPWVAAQHLSDPRLSAPTPHPTTWLVPASGKGLAAIAGQGSETLAIRLVSHPPTTSLCEALGQPLLSTSANPAAAPTATTASQALAYFSGDIDAVYDAPIGSAAGSSRIIDLLSGKVLRPEPRPPA